jgi:hypothetical protein
MTLQHGYIGTQEIKKAKEVFKNYYISETTNKIVFNNKSIYIQRKNNYVEGFDFTNIEELLEDKDCNLDTFVSIEDYQEQMLEIDEDYNFSEDGSSIIKLLKDGKTVYMCTSVGGNEYVGYDKDTIILEAVCDGEQFVFTLQEAWNNINSDNVNESLIIWLCS